MWDLIKKRIRKFLIIRAYKKIKNNGKGIIRQAVYISDQLGFCVTEVTVVLYRWEMK